MRAAPVKGWRIPLAAVALGLLCVLAYWRGLSSGFIFDDWSNLALLGQYGVIDTAEKLWLYLSSGFSGPTGRPLSHLSFLLDARTWPAEPWPFKRTNLLIHLLNGLLLWGLLRQLLLAVGTPAHRSAAVAVLAAGLWLLHPMWVSTTLYVVQRMAQLSALFSLLGLWWYVWARTSHAPRAGWPLYLHMALAVGGCGLLAVLSKENGALLPVLVLVLEVTVLAAHDRRQPHPPTAAFRTWRAVCVGLPAALVLGYWLALVPSLWGGEAGARAFTPYERLLTQGRVLWDYVVALALPKPGGGSLYNDAVVVSTGWFSPWTTAFAWVAWALVAGLVLRWRTRWPLAAAAVLFFLAGHLLESTFLQLELYFEHRNYLPAALLGLPVACALWPKAPAPGRPWWADRRVLAVLLLIGLAAVTAQRASVWGQPFVQALRWVQEQPRSPRALHHLSNFWQRTGHLEEAARLNRLALELDPNGLPWVLASVGLDCQQGLPPQAGVGRLLATLNAVAHQPQIATAQLNQLFAYLTDGTCRGYTPAQVLALVHEVRTSRLARDAQPVQVLLWQREAQLHLQQKRYAEAAQAFGQVRQLTPEPDVNLLGVAQLATHGQYRQALALLDTLQPTTAAAPGLPRNMPAVHRWYMAKVGYHEREMQRLRQALLDELKDLPLDAQPHPPEPPVR
jgi:tetratricopeptide (TPR) repeat protein